MLDKFKSACRNWPGNDAPLYGLWFYLVQTPLLKHDKNSWLKYAGSEFFAFMLIEKNRSRGYAQAENAHNQPFSSRTLAGLFFLPLLAGFLNKKYPITFTLQVISAIAVYCAKDIGYWQGCREKEEPTLNSSDANKEPTSNDYLYRYDSRLRLIASGVMNMIYPFAIHRAISSPSRESYFALFMCQLPSTIHSGYIDGCHSEKSRLKSTSLALASSALSLFLLNNCPNIIKYLGMERGSRGEKTFTLSLFLNLAENAAKLAGHLPEHQEEVRAR